MEMFKKKYSDVETVPNLFSFAGSLLTRLNASLSPTQSATHQYSGIICKAVAIFLKERKQRKVHVVSRPYCHTKTSL